MVSGWDRIRGVERERLHRLGVSEIRLSMYYKRLSGRPEALDREVDIICAFEVAVDGLHLSQEDETFVRTVLESGDAR